MWVRREWAGALAGRRSPACRPPPIKHSHSPSLLRLPRPQMHGLGNAAYWTIQYAWFFTLNFLFTWILIIFGRRV